MKEKEQPTGHGRVERAALYLRVSTEEQTTENQRPDLEQLAAQRRMRIVAVYDEQASAARKRPEFDRMLADAHRGAFDVLVVWALSRFGRSMVGNLTTVLELDRRGVKVVSVQETWLDTTSGPVRNLLIAVFSWVAEEERAQLVARTIAGLERAKRNGKRLGRPPATLTMAEHLQLHELVSVHGFRKAARQLGIGTGTLHRIVRRTGGTT
jgi:DNA invertase Pin-like site-specific DNA recombinase